MDLTIITPPPDQASLEKYAFKEMSGIAAFQVHESYYYGGV